MIESVSGSFLEREEVGTAQMNEVRPAPKSCPSSPAISLTSHDTRSIVIALVRVYYGATHDDEEEDAGEPRSIISQQNQYAVCV